MLRWIWGKEAIDNYNMQVYVMFEGLCANSSNENSRDWRRNKH